MFDCRKGAVERGFPELLRERIFLPETLDRALCQCGASLGCRVQQRYAPIAIKKSVTACHAAVSAAR